MWSTKHRGPMAIHAGNACTRKEYADAAKLIEEITGEPPPPLAELARGQVIGVVDVVDMKGDETDNPWAGNGCWWWMLENPRACRPFATRGRLGLFNVPDGAIKIIDEKKGKAA